MTKDNLTPRIRFKGFSDPWEQRKLTKILKPSKGSMKIGPFGSALKKEFYVQRGIKVYAQENVFNDDFKMGNYFINQEKFNELRSCELVAGDIVISMMGTIGACAIFPKSAVRGIMNSHLLRLQVNSKTVPEYIALLLSDSELILKQINRLSVGSIMNGLSSKIIKQLIFPITSLREERKIYKIFLTINNLIAANERQLGQLKILKKLLMQKIFSQEWRFKGFTDPWEQRKFKEIVQRQSNSTDRKDLPRIEYADLISGEGVLNKDVFTKHDTRKGTHFVAEDILFGKLRPYLKNWWLAKFEGVAIGDFWVLRSGHHSYPLFVFYLIQTDKFQVITSISTGTKMPRADWSITSQTDFEIPVKIVEQKQIGFLLNNLNKLIAANEDKLDQLKELKKYLMQNLFV